MPLHFTEQELADRREKVVADLQRRGLAALLIFRQESMYYLTGYDTMGYSQFQCLYLGDDGKLVLLTRSADLRQARLTSVIDDIRVWVDGADSNPGQYPGRRGVPGPAAGHRVGSVVSDREALGQCEDGYRGSLRIRGQLGTGERIEADQERCRVGVRPQSGGSGRRRFSGGPATGKGGHAGAGCAGRDEVGDLSRRRRLSSLPVHHRIGG